MCLSKLPTCRGCTHITNRQLTCTPCRSRPDCTGLPNVLYAEVHTTDDCTDPAILMAHYPLRCGSCAEEYTPRDVKLVMVSHWKLGAGYRGGRPRGTPTSPETRVRQSIARKRFLNRLDITEGREPRHANLENDGGADGTLTPLGAPCRYCPPSSKAATTTYLRSKLTNSNGLELVILVPTCAPCAVYESTPNMISIDLFTPDPPQIEALCLVES